VSSLLKGHRPLTALSIMAAMAMVGGSLAQAEVVDKKLPAPKEDGVTIHDDPVQLECWQGGLRIIRQQGLSGISVKSVTRKDAIAFKPVDSEQPEIFLLSLEDSLCLVSPED
jgi:hypothetical protein